MSGPDANLAGRPRLGQVLHGVDRRSAARWRPSDVSGTIIWREATDDLACDVAMLNLSLGGAAVLAEEAPQEGHSLWLLLDRASTGIHLAKAIVVDTRPVDPGRRALHLRFARPRPREPRPPRPRDRRLWMCYPVRHRGASLSWDDGLAERTIEGALLNISGGGAAFASDVLPPAGVPLRLRLLDDDGTAVGLEPVESGLVAITEDPSGLRIAHIRFRDPCPMEIFHLAVHGPGG